MDTSFVKQHPVGQRKHTDRVLQHVLAAVPNAPANLDPLQALYYGRRLAWEATDCLFGEDYLELAAAVFVTAYTARTQRERMNAHLLALGVILDWPPEEHDGSHQ